MTDIQPGCFFRARGKPLTRISKAGATGGKAKTTEQPVQPVPRDDSASGYPKLVAEEGKQRKQIYVKCKQ